MLSSGMSSGFLANGARAGDLLDVSLVPLVDVDGQVEMKSLVLFFMGNEKSLRGQQLTSMVDERRRTMNCRYLYVYACR